MRYYFLLIAGVVFLAPQAVFGGPWAKSPVKHVAREVKTQPRPRLHRIIFEDDTITAGRNTGAGDVVTVRRTMLMKSMVTVRPDFIPELVKSAEDI